MALVVCAVSAILWCVAFITINRTGHPYCCPFPPIVSAAQLVQIVRQTLARVLLLVVSLGYGIIRPKLQRMEWILVGLVTAFYFVAGILSDHLSDHLPDHLSGGDMGADYTCSSYPVFLFHLYMFLSLITLA